MSEKHLRAALAAKKYQNDVLSVREITDLLDYGMGHAQIKHMVDRFLAWRLPKPWNPDGGIKYERPNYAHAPADHDWPIGTNLLDAEQATAMVRHMIEGLPSVIE